MTIRKVLDARVAATQSEAPRHPRVEALTVNSVLQRQPSGLHCLSPDATALEALAMMAQYDIGAVLVLDRGRLVGTFSERDYARNSILATRFAATQLRELMTPCDTFATLTDSVQTCLRLMTENRLSYLPIQEGDNLVGLLSLNAFLSEMVAYLERVFKENELDQQIVFLRGTYSC